MSSQVKAAIISELGSFLYLAAWVVAMQWLYQTYYRGTPEAAWVVRAWAWWQARAERRWQVTLRVYQRPAVEEPPLETT